VANIDVEIVFALPGKQRLLSLSLPAGSTVDDAIAESAIARSFPEHDFSAADVGIWGRPADRDQVLSAGDRVEIYRPLKLDPREARRQLALVGKTMGKAPED